MIFLKRHKEYIIIKFLISEMNGRYNGRNIKINQLSIKYNDGMLYFYHINDILHYYSECDFVSELSRLICYQIYDKRVLICANEKNIAYYLVIYKIKRISKSCELQTTIYEKDLSTGIIFHGQNPKKRRKFCSIL